MPFSTAPAFPLEPPVFSQARLHDLTLGDAALQEQLLSSFLREAPSMRIALAAACADGGQPLADALHRLKGAARFVGGERLAQVIAALELAGVGSDAGARSRLLQLLEEQLSLLEPALAAWRPAAPGSGLE
jgi:HPt (histidine-containing phosphotransfer) domain-containing protein